MNPRIKPMRFEAKKINYSTDVENINTRYKFTKTKIHPIVWGLAQDDIEIIPDSLDF